MSHVIGQGDLKVSPLQLALVYAAVANGGNMLVPRMVHQIRTPDGAISQIIKPEVRSKIDLTPETLAIVKQGLDFVVNERGGTAYSSRLEEPRFAGKTGTAQVVRLPKNRRTHEKYQLQDHALFAAFAPVEDPKIVVVVIVEHGEHGSTAAAPVARAVIKTWFEVSGYQKPAVEPGP